jgi:hypothetical protein
MPMNIMSILVLVFLALVSLTCFGHEPPKRISIAPTNDLTALEPPDHVTIGASGWRNWKVSEAYRSGWGVGAINSLRGRANILVIDDGQANHDSFDKETGFPIIILINSQFAPDLRDLVQGYNFAMHQAWTRRQKTRDGSSRSH